MAARGTLLGMASTQLGVPSRSLTVYKGVVTGGGKTVKYSDLLGGKLFKIDHEPGLAAARRAPAKPVANYSLVGKTTPRIDLPDKVTGKYTYVHNIRVPGMLHARVVRPHGQGGVTSQNHFPLSVDPSSISHIPGVPGRPGRELPRGRRAEGVRRDSGCGAAEGGLEERSEARRLRQLLDVAAPGRRHEHDEPGPLHDERRQRRLGAQVVGEDASRRRTSTRSTATCRSARRARSPTTSRPDDDLVQLAAALDRPDDARRVPAQRPAVLRPAGAGHPLLLLRGLELVRLDARRRVRPDRRLHRRGRDLEDRRRSGAPAVDALGRARLGRPTAPAACST